MKEFKRWWRVRGVRKHLLARFWWRNPLPSLWYWLRGGWRSYAASATRPENRPTNFSHTRGPTSEDQ